MSVILGIIAGVVLGVLYSFGFIATGVIFWAYLAIGVLGVFLSPIYATNGGCESNDRCFCRNRTIILVASVGAIVSAAVGLIVAGVALTTLIAIVLGVATFFVVTLIAAIICLTLCLCND